MRGAMRRGLQRCDGRLFVDPSAFTAALVIKLYSSQPALAGFMSGFSRSAMGTLFDQLYDHYLGQLFARSAHASDVPARLWIIDDEA